MLRIGSLVVLVVLVGGCWDSPPVQSCSKICADKLGTLPNVSCSCEVDDKGNMKIEIKAN